MNDSIYDKPDGVYVVIKNWKTKEVGEVMGPMSGRKADRVEDGAMYKVDIDRGWGVRVTETLEPAERKFKEEKEAQAQHNQGERPA